MGQYEEDISAMGLDNGALNALLHATLDRLWKQGATLPNGPALTEELPKTLTDFLNSDFNHESAQDPEQLVATLCDGLLYYRCRLTHPRFFGFITGSTTPLSWLGDLITSAVNANPGSRFLGQGASDIERRMIRWCNECIGYDTGSGGVFVSGGSMANLTALAAARHMKLTEETHSKGVVYYSKQTHSSIAKALRMTGIYARQQRILPCDSAYRLDLQALEAAILDDKAAGHLPFAVVANAGSTNTGSIDDLNAIADICETHGVWLHVDGAFGASILLSPKYRSRLSGIARADSVSWDAHKWLFQTYGCSMVLVKRVSDLVATYGNTPEYLSSASATEQAYDSWNIGPELSRPARATKLWLTLNLMGTKQMAHAIEWGYRLVEWAAEALVKDPYWVVMSPPQQGIINFRYAPPELSSEQLDALNEAISQAMLDEGYAAVFTTRLAGYTVLRICALNPETTQQDMIETVARLTQFAQRLYAEQYALSAAMT